MSGPIADPQRFQKSRVKGWRCPYPKDTVRYVIRGQGPWGNPARIGDSFPDGIPFPVDRYNTIGMLHVDGADNVVRDAPHAVELYRSILLRSPFLVDRAVEHLRGYHLGCFCKVDAPCHADLLLAVANAPERGNATGLGVLIDQLLIAA